MRGTLVLGCVLLLACVEAPKPQPLPPTPDSPDLAQPDPADLAGVTNPSVDLALPPLTIARITPRMASTVGRERVTIVGTGFDNRTVFTFAGLQAEVESVTSTEAVVFTPAGGPWGVPITVAAWRSTDMARATNSNAANSPSAFRFYASVLAFVESLRINHNNYTNPRVPLLGDLNNDGRVDLIATYISTGIHSVHLNNGAGNLIYTFNDSNTPSNLGVQKGMLVDLDNDNNLDMLVADESATWQYNLGNGTGQMVARGQVRYSPGCTTTTSPIAFRIDGDMQNDVAVACAGNNVVRIYLGRGTANPGALYGGTNDGGNYQLTGLSTPHHLMATDLNKDGRDDLVVVNHANNAPTLAWYIAANNALPTTPTGTAGTNNANQAPYWGACGDLNNDTYPDCVVSDINTHTVRVFLNNGAGSLNAPVANGGTVPVGYAPREVSLDDVNGDGRLDIITANRESTSISIVLGRGDGTFGSLIAPDGRILTAQTVVGLSGCRLGWTARMADFDGDGIKELVGSCEQNERGETAFGRFVVFRNISR
ncbi:MAG: FG-GAP-like repeat-containing protein [Myxococcales bacterium]|nr:FG-GAP-like repeat-containing protein [Myxococcota bacterium]MDW8280074.1 FG-GAP-like repeat-containing protein [Myxococcales bacterium]